MIHIELIKRENRESFSLFDSIAEKYSYQSVDLHEIGDLCHNAIQNHSI